MHGLLLFVLVKGNWSCEDCVLRRPVVLPTVDCIAQEQTTRGIPESSKRNIRTGHITHQEMYGGEGSFATMSSNYDRLMRAMKEVQRC